ncbi:unnamed protein product, partial [Allacma fusca]
MLSVPNHWCHVPGKPNSTDIDVWKNFTLPTEIGPDGLPRLSKCEMFVWNRGNQTKMKCNEWDYDRTNYDRTLPSEYNWVCDTEYNVANVFSTAGAGSTVGTIFLGIAVDKFGRKSTYFSTVFCFTFFSLTSLFVPGNITIFLVLQFMLGISMSLILISPGMIAMELMGKEHRAWVYSVTGMAFVCGNALLPLISYLLRSWFLLGLLTPLSSIFILVYYKFLPESPRWLLSMGRAEEALKIVEDIAKFNGKSIPSEDLRQVFKGILARNDDSNIQNARMWDLFSKRSLAIRTIILGIASSANYFMYGGLLLNVTNMAGNEFLNYFLLAIIELPVGYVAAYLANRFGRRWTKTFLFLLTAIIFSIASIFVSSSNWVVVAATMSANFILAINITIGGLHETELFPTPLRSTGSSLVATLANLLSFSVPYIVQYGKSYAMFPYVIFTVVSLIGTIISPLLPETLGCKLPETLKDADSFGRGHKFWSFVPHSSPVKNPIIAIGASVDPDGNPVIKTACFYCNAGAPRIVQINVRGNLIQKRQTLKYIFPDFLQNFHGYKIRCAVSSKIVYRIEIYLNKHGYWEGKQGPHTNLIQLCQQKMNFTYELFPSNGGGGSGVKWQNGTWTGSMADVLYGNAEFGMVTAQTLQRDELVSFSFPITYDWLTFATGHPKPIHTWKKPFWPFSINLWLCLISTMILVITVLYVLPKLLVKFTFVTPKFYSNQIWFVAGTILEQDIHLPHNLVLRTFVTFWLLFALVVTTAYRSQLVPSLAFPYVEKPPQTFDQLTASSSYRWGLYYLAGAAYAAFRSSTNPTYIKI